MTKSWPSHSKKLKSIFPNFGWNKIGFVNQNEIVPGRRFYRCGSQKRFALGTEFFWGDKFKSVIVENGETLVNSLAHINLNPVRAGIVARPKDHRRNSVGWHVQTGNKDNSLSPDFGLAEFGERLHRYRRFLYETGTMDKGKGTTTDGNALGKEQKREFRLTRTDRFAYRTRHFL